MNQERAPQTGLKGASASVWEGKEVGSALHATFPGGPSPAHGLAGIALAGPGAAEPASKLLGHWADASSTPEPTGPPRGLLGGVASAAVHPIQTAKGLQALSEHIPVLGTPGKLLHGAFNLATGQESFKDFVHHDLNPGQSFKDDLQFGKTLVNGLIDPSSRQADPAQKSWIKVGDK